MDQIRAAFTRHDVVAERMRSFRRTRVEAIAKATSAERDNIELQGDEVPFPLTLGPKLILHLIPFSAAATNKIIDIQQAREELLNGAVSSADISRTRFNLDGVVGISIGADEQFGYFQIYRTGIIEYVETLTLANGTIDGLAHYIRDAYSPCVELVKRLELVAPIVVFLSLVGVRGRTLYGRRPGLRGMQTTQRRDRVSIPEVELPQFDQDPDELLRNLLDVCWQAFGGDRCPFFDENGTWRS